MENIPYHISKIFIISIQLNYSWFLLFTNLTDFANPSSESGDMGI